MGGGASPGQADGGGAGDPELDPPFDVIEPARPTCPLVLSSPHSGSVYPQRFLDIARLDAIALRRSEDAFVDDLFAGAASLGAPLIRARFPRAYLDLNREPYELDPRMFEGKLPPHANTRSVRVAGGLGTIARVVGDSQEIYAGRLTVAEGLERVDRLYKPYHAALRGLVERAQRQFGYAVLIDCHSMPSTPTVAAAAERRIKTDFVVGDRYGTSADGSFVELLEKALRRAGYAVHRNKPYAGGFITEHYGAPQAGVHAIQIEVNRALYMDERTIERAPRFEAVKADVTAVLAILADAGDGSGFRKAAE